MSFHFTCNRFSREQVAMALEGAHLPHSVHAFIRASVDAVPAAHRNDLTPHFTISASGHLHNGTDLEHSTSSISVQPGWDARRTETDGA